MARRGAASAAVWLLLASCAARPPAYMPDAPMVDKVTIEGADAIPERKVKKKIVTTASSWLPAWVPFFGDAQWFDENAWQADLRRIERLYQSSGYYQVRIAEDEVKQTKAGHVEVRVKVVEGKPARLLKLEVRGLDALPPEHKRTVVADLPLREGEVFTEEAWEQAKRQLSDRLRQLGYAEAVVSGEVIVDTGVPSADALLEAKTDVRFKFGKVFVASDPKAKVPNKVIVDEVQSVIKEGQWFSDSALAEAQQQVFSLGVFGAVKVNRGAADRANDTVPVVVDVREAPFQSLRFGLGIGIDALRNEAHVIAEYANRNFFGGLRRLSIRGKGGYAFLPNVVEVATNGSNAKHGPLGRLYFEFEQPRMFHRTLSLQTSLDLNAGLEPAYSYWGFTYRGGVAWRPLKFLSFEPGYNLDLYRLSSSVPLGSAAPDVLYGCPLTCIVSYFELSTTFDWRDSILEPKNGIYAALSLQGGGRFIGSSFTFFRITPELRGYISFAKDDQVTIAAKVKLGTLLSADGSSPIIARFFAGGGNSMRGFSTRRLAPHLAIAVPVEPLGELQPAEVVPIGGRGLWEGSLEVRWNVWGDLVLAAFGDNGFVTGSDFKFGDGAYFAGNMFWAVGGGLRYRTPIGPIRLDFAYRLPIGPPLEVVAPESPTYIWHTNGGCFGLGARGPSYAGSPEGQCSVHLSVGEAF